MSPVFYFVLVELPFFMPNPRFHPFVRIVLCAFAVIASILVWALLAFSLLLLSGQIPLENPANTPGPLFQIPPRLLPIFMVAQAPAIIMAVALCRRWLDARPFASLGLRARNGLQFFSGAFCGLLAISFLFGLLWIGGQVQIIGLSSRALEVGPNGIALRLLFWAVAMLGVGVSEEILFRGYLLHNTSAWLGGDKTALGAAAILQALLFGLVHMGNLPQAQSAFALQSLPNLILIGIFFALCAFKTGSLWFPIGFHASWNFLLGSIFSLPVSGLATFRLFETEVSGSRWLTGGAFGAEGSLLLTILIIVMIYVIRQAPDQPQVLADIASLRPQDEPDEVEVASRAPSLRERKEQRRAQTQTASGFEGWNDLAPPQRQRYSTYQPPQTQPSEAQVIATTAFPESAFAENAPLSTEPVAVPLTEPSTADFAAYRPSVPPLTDVPVEASTEPQVAAQEVIARPETVVHEAPPVANAAVANAPKPVVNVPSAPEETPKPPVPPVKKPPAPRW